MRTVGHTLDLTLIQSTFERAKTKLEEYPSKRAIQKQNGNAAFFRMWVLQGLNLARTGYIFDLPLLEIKKVIGKSLAELHDVVDIDGAISPIDMRRYLGAALVSEDVGLMKWLAQLPKPNYTLSAIEISKAGYFLVHAIQAGVLGERKEFDLRQTEFSAALTKKQLKVNPDSEQHIYEPLAVLLASISAGDQTGFDKAWIQQSVAWNKRYGRPSEKANCDGILDLEVLGIGKIAEKFGLRVPATNPYAPVELLASGKSA